MSPRIAHFLQALISQQHLMLHSPHQQQTPTEVDGTGAACVGNPYVHRLGASAPPVITDRHMDALEVVWNHPEVVAHFAERQREDDGSLEAPESSDRIA